MRQERSRVVYWIGQPDPSRAPEVRMTGSYPDLTHSDGATSPHPRVREMERELKSNGFYAKAVSDHIAEMML